mmetsp:Transcript_63380/g.142964  ORF Transcript_63380/g.142964 Transcript_63380/m.142964 type:complete len:392 (+) Transcript_63380:626-1801(+)
MHAGPELLHRGVHGLPRQNPRQQRDGPGHGVAPLHRRVPQDPAAAGQERAAGAGRVAAGGVRLHPPCPRQDPDAGAGGGHLDRELLPLQPHPEPLRPRRPRVRHADRHRQLQPERNGLQRFSHRGGLGAVPPQGAAQRGGPRREHREPHAEPLLGKRALDAFAEHALPVRGRRDAPLQPPLRLPPRQVQAPAHPPKAGRGRRVVRVRVRVRGLIGQPRRAPEQEHRQSRGEGHGEKLHLPWTPRAPGERDVQGGQGDGLARRAQGAPGLRRAARLPQGPGAAATRGEALHPRLQARHRPLLHPRRGQGRGGRRGGEPQADGAADRGLQSDAAPVREHLLLVHLVRAGVHPGAHGPPQGPPGPPARLRQRLQVQLRRLALPPGRAQAGQDHK